MTAPVPMPVSTSQCAPRFSSHPSGFDSFFDDVAELAKRAQLSEKDAITWACRYAGLDSDCWKSLPCLKADRAASLTLDEFKKEVLGCYPHLSEDRRYTYHGLKLLVKRTQDYRTMSLMDLGDYYRKFLTFSNYLIDRGHLSEHERDTLFLQGFPRPVRANVLQRLAIAKPDICPREPYPFLDAYKAAIFILSTGSRDLDIKPDHVSLRSETEEQAPFGDLIQAMSNLTRVLVANVQPQQRLPPSPAPPRPHSPAPAPERGFHSPPQCGPSLNPESCMFCSSPEHFARECSVVAKYIQQRKIIRNGHGKLSLPDGNYPSRNVPGRNMRERVDNYWNSKGVNGVENNNHGTISTHSLKRSDEYAFTPDVSPAADDRPNSSSRNDDVDVTEHIRALVDSLFKAKVSAAEKGKA